MPHARACGLALSVALSGIALGSAGCSHADPGAAAAAQRVAWTEDPRLVELLSPCPTLGPFSADTSDLVPVMVEKMTTAPLDVARNLREELVALGDESVPALEALIRRYYTDPLGSPPLRNALGVLRLSKAESAHAVLRLCLEHPNEDIRTLAAAGLAEHPNADDYDVLLSVLAVAAPNQRPTIAKALHHSDPERFQRDLADWIAQDRERDLWLDGSKLVASTAGPNTGTLFSETAKGLDLPVVRAFLLAALVRAGDEDALDELRRLVMEGDRAARTSVLEAIETTGRWQEVLPILADPDPVLRLRAASLLAPVASDPRAREALETLLRDPDPGVRAEASKSLLAVGDAAAADQAIEMLRGGERELRDALIALRDGWATNPGLAERAFAVLRELEVDRETLSLSARSRYLRAIGQVPLAAAAEFLLAQARGARGEELDRMPAHRWLAREAGNTAEGRAVLREAWRGEEDARARMDLLEGATFGLDDVTRDFLLEVVQSERASPWETLYASERAARQGPSRRVAPILKRVALRCDDEVVRPALDCLLWRWYGES